MGTKGPQDAVLAFFRSKLKKDYWVIKRRPWLKYVFLALGLFIAVGAYGAYYYVYRYSGDLKDDQGRPLDFSKLARSDFKKASYVYADDGEIVGRFFGQPVLDPIKIAEVPELLKDAFIAAEDRRFNENRPKRLWMDSICDPLYGGVDPCAILRAGLGNITRDHRLSGASGIRQQFVRLWYGGELAEFRTRQHSIKRKVKEARLAIQISRKYRKDEILEGFLNLIYFGHGAQGVLEAPRRYFGKDLRRGDKLTLREIAILASLNKSPTLYDPIFHKPAKPSETAGSETQHEYESALAHEMARVLGARDRSNWVLGRMLEDGYISRSEYQKALFKEDEPLDLPDLNVRPLKNPGFGYGDRLVKEMLLGSGHSEDELSASGGLRIHTTIDAAIQRIATNEFEKHLILVNQEKEPDDHIEGAFVIIEVKTGKILALSGGHNFDESQYNRVMASRSPGSAFKPFTYAAAMEYFGKGFFDPICNCPFSMRGSSPGKRWVPKNFREDNPVPYGNIPFATGLIRSVNLATLNLARSMDIRSVVKLANDMGVWGNPGMVRDSDGNVWFKRPGYEIKGGLVPLLPTAIGASDVNLLELANAYTVFFRDGAYIRPTLINEIDTTNGDLMYRPEPPAPKRVLSKETTQKMVVLMRAVTKIGTAKVSMRGIEQQMACKTGTSNGPTDLMLICGNPDLVMAIRFGYDKPKPIELPVYMKKISGAGNLQVSGGWVVGPLFRKIVDQIYTTRPKVEFDPMTEEELQALDNRLPYK